MLENRTYGSDDSAEKLVRYVYSNHLQSASLELDEHAAVISYEEYHPYGTTAFKYQDDGVKATAKRYRYTGKERDEESGLYYHGARYYIPWLCRWCAIDPLESKYSPQSPFVYCSDNPINRVDPSGMGDDPTLVKPKVKVNPNVVKELTKDLPEGGKQISKEFADELLKKAEQTAVKKTEKEVLKDGAKAVLKKVAGAPLDILIYVLQPVHAIPGTGELPQFMKDAENAKLIRPKDLNSQELNELVKRLQVTMASAPYERVTTDISKLTGQDLAAISKRIREGKATEMDKIFDALLRDKRSMFELNPKHDKNSSSGGADASIAPDNHANLWDQRETRGFYNVKTDTWWIKEGDGKKAVFHLYMNDRNGAWHWAGSTAKNLNRKGKVVEPIPETRVPIEIKILK